MLFPYDVTDRSAIGVSAQMENVNFVKVVVVAPNHSRDRSIESRVEAPSLFVEKRSIASGTIRVETQVNDG